MGNVLTATITALGALMGPLGMIFVMGILMPFVNKPVRYFSQYLREYQKGMSLKSSTWISGRNNWYVDWLCRYALDYTKRIFHG